MTGTGGAGGSMGAGGNMGSAGTTGMAGRGGTMGTAGTMGSAGTTGVGGTTGLGGLGGAGGSPTPFQPLAAAAAVRKVKNLLTGLPPTDAEIAMVTSQGQLGMQTLINGWMADATTGALFKGKMVTFFRNFFQQTGFQATEDFKIQLLQNGGFDFGPIGTGAVGDDAFYRLVQNLEDSFALTAWQLVAERRPFTEVLTTQRFMMTTGLKSLYIEIETAPDAPYNNSQLGAGLDDRLQHQPDHARHGADQHGVQRRAPRQRRGQLLAGQRAGLPRRGRRDRFLSRHVAAVPAPARLHAAAAVLGQPDLLRARVETILHDRRSDGLADG